MFGLSEGKNNSHSRERSITENSTALTNKLESTMDQYKAKISILLTTNDKIVNENAMLRLKRKFCIIQNF